VLKIQFVPRSEQPVLIINTSDVQILFGKSLLFVRDPYKIQKYTLFAGCRIFKFNPGGALCNHRDLRDYVYQYAVQQHLVHLLNHFPFIVKFISRLWLLFCHVSRDLRTLTVI